MKKRLMNIAALSFAAAVVLVTATKASSIILYSFDGKVKKVSVSYMVYNNGSQRFVTENLAFADPFKSVSPNASFTLVPAPPFTDIDGEMLVDSKAWILFNGTLLEVSKGMVGEIACSGRIIVSGNVTFNGVDYLGTGEVIEFEGVNVVNMVAKEDKNGQIVGVTRMVIVPVNPEIVDVVAGVITGRTPTSVQIKITPMKFQQTII